MSWTRAVHLKAWADTQEARHTLPYLVRRLVRAVTPRSATVLFPAHEQVQRPGFDGVVEASAGSQFVPNGKSVWEMGADGDPASKANGDYAKRTEETDAIMRSDCTFVFVTPREWRKKDDWATEKRASGDWKDVCAFDANDLEHWLDICPREDIWFSAMTGRRPAGVRDLRLKWDGLKAVAEHPLTPEVFLASREQTRAALSTWSREGAASAVLSCESIGDGIDFLTAFVAASSPNSEELDRIIFAESIDAWRRLAASRDPLFLVASDALRLTADDVAEAVEIGHHVLVVAGRAPCAVGRVIELPRQESNAVETALTKCGFDAARSHSLARASCGSSSILKRLMSRHPQTVYPDWSKPGSREELAAYSLVGGWMHVDPRPSENELFPSKPPIDISCVEYLTGNSQESIEQAVARWSSCDEPLFLHFHKSVLVASREDAWHLLAGAITPEQLARFEELATLVLEEDDPSFELDKYERWLANIRGKVHSLSNDMRRGVVETLALMATYPIANVPAFDLTFDAAVRRVLDRVLPPDASWARWATLDRYLPMLAEADPDFLLGRIEADLSLSSPQIASLYRNGGDGLFSGQLHCGLLWALEVLAWDVAYLPRVSAVLAKLADVERSLDHKTGNSATNSFHAIYLSWLPQTNATVEQRISSLRALLKRHSDVAWPLIVGMLPDGIHAVSHPTQQPRWRNWAAGWSREYAHRDYIAYVAELVALTIETAGQSLVRWSEILDGVLQFTGEIAANTLSQLATIAAKSSDNAGRDTLWRTIRDMTARHRAYANANWALPEEILISLDQIQSQLTPGAIVVLHSWLFDHHPDLPGFDGAENFEKYDSELQARRVAALREIVDAEGWDGVACLLEDAEAVNVIGWIVGEHSLLDVSSIALWSLVTAENPRLNEFAARYVAGSIHAKGIQYLSLIGLHDRPPIEAGTLLSWLGNYHVLWNWIDANAGSETRSAYWQRCRGFLHVDNRVDLAYAIENLLTAMRPFTAADALHMAMHRVDADADLIFRVLEAGLYNETNEESTGVLDVYATQQLIKHLQDCGSQDVSRLALVEWGYLPVLERINSPVGPSTLIAEIQQSPQFFVDLLTIVYRRANGEPRDEPMNELEVGRCKLARQLLEAIDKVPGIKDGESNIGALRSWTREIRDLATKADRIDIADITLGRIFSQFLCLEEESLSAQCSCVCGVLEEVGSLKALEGLANGLINNRGVVGRGPFDGGRSERTLAKSYRMKASALDTTFPRVAAALRELAEDYERDAQREDVDARRRRIER